MRAHRLCRLGDTASWTLRCHGDDGYHAVVFFQIVGQISHVETIAAGRQIRQLARLKKLYGAGRWRKMKGEALIRLDSGEFRRAEVHWYEAQGVGKRHMKFKRYLD